MSFGGVLHKDLPLFRTILNKALNILHLAVGWLAFRVFFFPPLIRLWREDRSRSRLSVLTFFPSRRPSVDLKERAGRSLQPFFLLHLLRIEDLL